MIRVMGTHYQGKIVALILLFPFSAAFPRTKDTGTASNSATDSLSRSDRRSMVIAGNKIRTRLSNFGSIGGPKSVNSPKIEWPAYSGREYGYEFGPVVGARIENIFGDSVSLTEDGIQDSGTGRFEPDGIFMNPSDTSGFASSTAPSSWPPAWKTWLGDSTYSHSDSALANLETMYVMTDQDSTDSLWNADSLERLTPGMNGLGIQITARTYQYSDSSLHDILFLTYVLKNINTNPIPNAFFGFFSDGSVGGSDNFEDNTTRTDLIDSGIVYSFATNGIGSQTIPAWSGITPGWLGEVVLETPSGDNGNPLGITSCYLVHYGNLLNSQDSLVYQIAFKPRSPVSNLYPPDTYDGDSVWWLTSGPFTLQPEQSKRFEIAIAVAADSVGLMDDLKAAIRLKANNYVTTGVVTHNHPSLPADFSLYQNYPNPFNPSTIINYQLKSVGHVTLKVYDILGREVATLVDCVQSAGDHNVVFDGSRFASGVYFYRIQTGSYVRTMKMVLMK